MKLLRLLNLLFIPAVLASCTKYAYYQNPFHTNTSPYKTIPLHTDSARHAWYTSGAITLGGANNDLRDGVIGFLGSAYRSHSGKYLQGYYGLNFGLGGYNVARSVKDNNHNYYMNDSLLNSRSGAKFFGGIGAAGGVNLTIPFGRNEWRIVGLEASWMQEFGHYQRFRRQLPDSAANLIARPNNYLTLGLHTDLVFATRHGAAGFKTGVSWFTHSDREFDVNGKATSPVSAYFTQTVHVTKNRTTGFIQWNFGYHAASFLMGASYRLK